MELRHLRTLVAIADYGGFAVAGAAIGLTQSAVSLHVKALEEGLGALLFDRSKRPPLLNPHGADLVERAREIVRLCADLEDSLTGADIAGVLELGAIPTVLTGTLPAALASLAAAHPGLLVRLTSGLSAELARRVYKGELDAGIVTEPVELAAGLSWHPIAAEPLVVIAPEDASEDSDHQLLESRPFIRFKRFAWAGQLIDARLRDRGIKGPYQHGGGLPGGHLTHGGPWTRRVGGAIAKHSATISAPCESRRLRTSAGAASRRHHRTHQQPQDTLRARVARYVAGAVRHREDVACIARRWAKLQAASSASW